MRLTDLLPEMMNIDPIMRETEISGLTADSRRVEPGYLFAALPSATENSGTDGRDYIEDAVARGAVAILAPDGTTVETPGENAPCVITDENPRWRLAQFASRFYEKQPRTVVGITGNKRQIVRRRLHATDMVPCSARHQPAWARWVLMRMVLMPAPA